ncbi:MAG: HNH endonuclease [Acidimicrobiia bacterium]|nr:HNH endonuclease [Acidimicrobiia bacterium]
MLGRIRQIAAELGAAMAELDPACFDGRSAGVLMEEFARIEHFGGAGKTLMARRVDDVRAFNPSQHRSAAHYLAKVSGTSVFAAEQTIRTSHEVGDLPATEAALRAGALSSVQAKEVAAAASADPSAESLLLSRASTDGIKGLKAEAARVIAAASTDENARYDCITRERTFRHWRDHDGSGRIDVRGPLDLTARVALALAPYEAALFAAAKDRDEPVNNAALMFDALVAMADASAGEMPKGSGPLPTVNVRIDHRAFVAGDTEPGEVCEIVGLGPIPVSVARRLADDAFLKAIITGVNVLTISHLGRTIPAHLRTALDELFPECAIEGCNVAWSLEIDHNQPFEARGPTALWNLNKLCRYHHQQKTRHDLRLVGEGTNKRLVPKAEWHPPDRITDRKRQGQPPRRRAFVAA